MSEIERWSFCRDLSPEARDSHHMCPFGVGAWVRHSDHLAELAARDEEIERLKALMRATAVEEYVEEAREPRDMSNLYKAEQALPAELERMAEELERQATDEDTRRIPHLIADTRREAASHLRERAGEIRGGDGG